MSTGPAATDAETAVSPLYDPLADNTYRGPIRESDYGEREDVVAEQEEVNHEINAFEPTDRPSYYPPSSAGQELYRKGGPRNKLDALSIGIHKHKTKARLVVFVVVVWPILCWTVVYHFLSDHPALFPRTLQNARSTLLVVAHPDDECLFFAPTVLASVWQAKSHGALLVLSSGNHYGLGATRKQELKGSCKALGIRDERCDVVDLPSMQDDPEKWWPVDIISQIVQEHIDKWLIDSILTFDEAGISGHINHRAVSAAVTQLALSLSIPKPGATRSVSTSAPSLFVLKSVHVLRKYAGLYDLPISVIPFVRNIIFGLQPQLNEPLSPPYNAETEMSTEKSEMVRKKTTKVVERGLLLSGWSGYRSARRAFWSHKTQLVWDRHIYMIISRYMYFNTIERVV